MDEFNKRLTAIRMGGKKMLGKGVDKLIEKQKGVTDARREKNRDLAEKAGGGQFTKEDAESGLFDSPYKKPAKAIGKVAKKAKGFFDRLVSVRGGEKKEEWSPENQ